MRGRQGLPGAGGMDENVFIRGDWIPTAET